MGHGYSRAVTPEDFFVEAARKRWFLGAVVGVGSCYENSSGCVVVVVGKSVSDAA